jgi:hypothetical protein
VVGAEARRGCRHQALLTFGHAGYSEELRAGQRIRDLIGLEIGDGTAQIAKLVLAREMLGRAYAPLMARCAWWRTQIRLWRPRCRLLYACRFLLIAAW